MKKRILVLAAFAGALTFASCGGDNANEGTYTKAQVDSMTKASADSIAAAAAAEKDSMLRKAAEDSLAAAQAAAAAAASGGTVGKPSKPSTTKPVTTKPTPKPVPEKPRTQEDIIKDKKASRFDDEKAKQNAAKDAADKKASRFDENKQNTQSTSDKKASRF